MWTSRRCRSRTRAQRPSEIGVIVDAAVDSKVGPPMLNASEMDHSSPEVPG